MNVDVEALIEQLKRDQIWQENLTPDEIEAALAWARDFLRKQMGQAVVKACGRLLMLGVALGPKLKHCPQFMSRESVLRLWLVPQDTLKG